MSYRKFCGFLFLSRRVGGFLPTLHTGKIVPCKQCIFFNEDITRNVNTFVIKKRFIVARVLGTMLLHRTTITQHIFA